MDKAKWIWNVNDGMGYCSNCKIEMPFHATLNDKSAFLYVSNYCPNCGAEMDKSDFIDEDEE